MGPDRSTDPHPWATVGLWLPQQNALERLEALLQEGPPRRPICLVGPFGSGKTTLARYWLARHLDRPESAYCALNRRLLDALKAEEKLSRLATLPAKTRLLLQLATEDLLTAYFQQASLLVLDCLELLHPYRLSPVTLAAPHARAGNTIILCLPDDPVSGFTFAISPDQAELIRIEEGS